MALVSAHNPDMRHGTKRRNLSADRTWLRHMEVCLVSSVLHNDIINSR